MLHGSNQRLLECDWSAGINLQKKEKLPVLQTYSLILAYIHMQMSVYRNEYVSDNAVPQMATRGSL